jgi:hypothetical protein
VHLPVSMASSNAPTWRPFLLESPKRMSNGLFRFARRFGAYCVRAQSPLMLGLVCTLPSGCALLLMSPEASSGSYTINYSPNYIHYWNANNNKGFAAGGPNVQGMKADADHPAGGGAGTCCSTFPRKWQPGTVVTVRWLVNRNKQEIYYTAQATIPPYGGRIGSVYGVFLPGDRVRILVQSGELNPFERVPDDDPYIAQGVPDEAAIRAAAEKKAADEAWRARIREKEKEWDAEREKLPKWEDIIGKQPPTLSDGPP